MNIGSDLDKVLINYPPFIPAIIIDRLYKKKADGILLYRIPSKPEQAFRKLLHLPMLRQPIAENLNFLKNCSKKNSKFFLISSRFNFLKGITNKLIRKYNLDNIFDEMYFNFSDDQPHVFKDKIIKKLKLDIYVDDDLPLLEYVAKRNKSTKFFWLTKNKNKSVDQKNIFAIQKLSDIFTK